MSENGDRDLEVGGDAGIVSASLVLHIKAHKRV
jgi:hypothetical protein